MPETQKLHTEACPHSLPFQGIASLEVLRVGGVVSKVQNVSQPRTWHVSVDNEPQLLLSGKAGLQGPFGNPWLACMSEALSVAPTCAVMTLSCLAGLLCGAGNWAPI